jgi:hypothetical protein
MTDDGRQVMAKDHIAFGKVSLKSTRFVSENNNNYKKKINYQNESILIKKKKN